MIMKIKSWKVEQIMRDMSYYGDKFNVDIEGQEWGTYFKACEDENGYLTVKNIYGIEKETEKAMCLNIDGFKTWVPKSAIA